MERLELRAWHRKNKKMFDVYQWNRGDEIDNVLRLVGFNQRETLFVDEDIDLIQFTGVLDEQGNKIWEGDIVQFDIDNPKVSPKPTVSVFYNHGAFYAGTHVPHLLSAICNVVSVVGNIFKNPELLEEKKGK